MFRFLKRYFDRCVLSSSAEVLLPLVLVVSVAGYSFALEPNEILVIANADNPASMRVARHYCQKRDVPEKNILKLDLKPELTDVITRSDYEKLIARPVRDKLSTPDFAGRIKCLLTVYGVPFRVGPRGILKGEQANLAELSELARHKTDQLEDILRQFESLTGLECTLLADNDKQPSARNILKELESYIKKTQAKIDAIADKAQKRRLLNQWFSLYANLYGKTRTLQTAQAEADLSIRLTEADEAEILQCNRLFRRAGGEKWGFEKCLKAGFYEAVETVAGIEGLLLRLNADIDNIKGTETGASVDSELSMVMFDDYELYRQQPNELKDRIFWTDTKTIMVSRIDGPGEHIAAGLVDKAFSAERNGLNGIAYIDSGYSVKKKAPLYVEYDESLQQTAVMIARRTGMKVVQEQTPKLFTPGQCPKTGLYCGWYSLKKYVDAFDFVAGAVGFHIASWEAIDLRDPQSTSGARQC